MLRQHCNYAVAILEGGEPDANRAAAHPPLTRDEATTLLGKTMGLVAVTAGLFAFGAYIGRNVADQWGWLFFIGFLLLLVVVNIAAQRSEQAAIELVFGFGVRSATVTSAPRHAATASGGGEPWTRNPHKS